MGRVLFAASCIGALGLAALVWVARSGGEVPRSERAAPAPHRAARERAPVLERAIRRRDWPSLYLVRGPRGELVQKAVYDGEPADGQAPVLRWLGQVQELRIAELERRVPCDWQELDRARERLSEIRRARPEPDLSDYDLLARYLEEANRKR